MGFVQIIEFTATRIDEVRALDEAYMAATEGQLTIRRQTVCVDRDNPTRYVAILEFDSYEAAVANSELPETLAAAERFFDLCDTHVHYSNLDVVESHIF